MTCVICIGQNSPKGWFLEEIERALDIQTKKPNFRVIPVLLPGAKTEHIPVFLSLRTWADFREGQNEEYAFLVLKKGILGEAVGRRLEKGDDVTSAEGLKPYEKKISELAQLQGLGLREELVIEFQREVLKPWLERARTELTPDHSKSTQPPLEGSGGVKTVRIFLASSAELREDRDKFDLYFRQQNDLLRKQGVYLEIVRWENFLDVMSSTRLQDEYNRAIRNCDIFVSLFKTKTGKYTEEEFDVAHQTFQETGKPLIYTYFQKALVSTSSSNRADLISLWNFQEKLGELEHFFTEYETIEGLQKHFRDQLDKLQADNLLKL